MVRRVTSHYGRSKDGEQLQIVVCYEPGVTKEQVKKENRYSKKHQVLVGDGHFYRYKQKRA